MTHTAINGVATNYVTVGNLLRSPQQYFEIPKYQRDYAWDEEQVDDFCADIVELVKLRQKPREATHFFGAIVLVEGDRPGSGRSRCEVIDGQQRLTTFVLLVAVVQHALILLGNKTSDPKIAKLAAEMAGDLSKDYLSFRELKDDQYVDHPRVLPSGPDRTFFQALLGQHRMSPSRESHKRLQYAYKAIGKSVSSLLPKSFGKMRFRALVEVKQSIDLACYIVQMLTSSTSSGYNLFSVLNDRGISLSNGNLLRAETLGLLEDHDSQQREAEAIWDDLLADPPTRTDDFLTWYYSAQKGRRLRVKEIFRDFRDAFFFRPPIEMTTNKVNQVVGRLRDLKNGIELMRVLVQGNWPYELQQPVTMWDASRLKLLIEQLSHTNCMPLLYAATQLPQKHFSECVRAIELFFFRYKVICNKHIGPATRVYEKHAEMILNGSTRYQPKSLRRDLGIVMDQRTSDTEFRSIIENLSYAESRQRSIIKYLFITIEDYLNWLEGGSKGFQHCTQRNRVIDYSSSTFEHIYPRNAKAADRDKDLEEVKDSIGNLTLLAPDENVFQGNEHFEKKRKNYGSSVVDLTRRLTRKQKWTRQHVEERQELVIRIALGIFRLK